jgi:YVTN family beta-propeller protein
MISFGVLALGGLAALAIALANGGGRPPPAPSSAPFSSGAPRALTIHVAAIDQLPAGHPPGAVAIVGRNAAVADPSGNSIVIVYPDGRPPATVAVGQNPIALAADPSGRVWVADSGSGDVRVIDPGTRRTVAHVVVGTTPSAIAIGGGYAWVADQGSNDVRTISLRTLRPKGPAIPTGGHAPVALAYGPGGTVWVANKVSSDVTVIRGHHAGPSQFIQGGPISIAPGASAGTRVGTASGNVVHLSEADQVSGQPIDLHSGPASVAVVGDSVWVLTRDDATLSMIPTAGAGADTVRARVSMSPAEGPTALSCSPHLCVATDQLTRQVVAATF